MNTWSADQYLKFGEERTRPCRDLAGRILIADARRIVDLGCGPGNSTEVLASRWPKAELTGIDSSAGMIEVARRNHPEHHWILEDIATWAARDNEPFDIVLSNAALHWVPDHALVFPRLFARVAPAGALAIQMPADFDAPAHQAMRELAASTAWRHRFPSRVKEWETHGPAFYYDLLSQKAASLDLWETEYTHILPGSEAIVEWYKGSGLRPFLDALSTDALRETFIADYSDRVRKVYPSRPSGGVLLPFKRLFLIAYRG